jgi:hypothetical protein
MPQFNKKVMERITFFYCILSIWHGTDRTENIATNSSSIVVFTESLPSNVREDTQQDDLINLLLFLFK